MASLPIGNISGPGVLYSDASWLSAGIYEIRGFRDGNSAPTFQGQFIAQEPSTLKNFGLVQGDAAPQGRPGSEVGNR